MDMLEDTMIMNFAGEEQNMQEQDETFDQSIITRDVINAIDSENRQDFEAQMDEALQFMQQSHEKDTDRKKV